jgi:hypothetical protein
MTESEGPPKLAELIARLRQPGAQLALLGGLLGVMVLAILLTDLATGGHAEPPPALGSTIQVTPGARTVIVPTLAPIGTPTPVIASTPTPSSEADALARDAQRLQDLALIEAALAEYRDRFGEYPNTSANLQTMCNYKDLDKGCDLKKVLDKDQQGILEDPLGEPLANGYWYASDGKSYTIWMLREGPGKPGDPICTEVVPHLKDKGSLFCITVGSAPQ